MGLILSIETATNCCSVAIHNEGVLLGTQSLLIEQSHSSLLVPTIKSLAAYCGIELNALSAVAISKGPGSYTGLRIGTSTAKGLCHALDLPLIGINTLEALAMGVSQFIPDSALVCPMIDARRMEVYCLIADRNLKIIKETIPEVIDNDSFEFYLKNTTVYFFGNGADKCQPIIKHENAKFLNAIHPDAVHVGSLAWHKFEKKEFEDVAYFDPFYLKEFRVTKPKQK